MKNKLFKIVSGLALVLLLACTGVAFGATRGYLFSNDDGSVTGVVQKLATVSSINLKSTGQTTLYTVPAGKTLVITSLPIKITASSAPISVATARVGVASAYTEYMAATALTGLTVLGNYTDLAVASLLPIHQTFAAGSVIKLDITGGAVATTLTGEVDVIGYLY